MSVKRKGERVFVDGVLLEGVASWHYNSEERVFEAEIYTGLMNTEISIDKGVVETPQTHTYLEFWASGGFRGDDFHVTTHKLGDAIP